MLTIKKLNHRKAREVARAGQAGVPIDCIECIIYKYNQLSSVLTEKIKRENLQQQMIPVISEAIWNLAKTIHGFHDQYGMPN